MAPGLKRVYDFGPFHLDPEERVLLREGRPVPLTPKVFETLAILLENSGRLIEKEELKKKLWPETFVEDGNLTFNISVLRKALGDDRQNGNRYIETVPRRGYRFIAQVVATEIPAFSLKTDARQPPGGADLQEALAGEVNSEAYPLKRTKREVREAFGPALAGAVILMAGCVIYWMTRPLPVPRVLAYRQLTDDGRVKPYGRLVTDGARVYFSESTAEGCAVAWVSVQGGPVTQMPTSLRHVLIMDISRDRSELLVGAPAPGGPDRALWILPVSGGSPRRLGDLAAHSASWSPDGRFIAYANDRDLYLANAEGSETRKVVTLAGFIVDPRWRPDGSKVCFEVGDSHGSSSLWEVEASGKNCRRMLPGWSGPHNEGGGLWTGDAKYFIFESSRNGRGDIWAVNERAGLLGRGRSEAVRLNTGPLSFTGLVFSPDDRKLFAVGGHERGGAELVRYESGQREFIPYLRGIPAHWVSFSRDGEWVAYLKFREDTLWRMRPDGSDPRQLTFAPMDVAGLDWSPDGKQIAFRAKKPGNPYKIYLISAEGGALQELVPQHREEEGIPTWSPDGKHIAFGDVPVIFGHAKGGEAIHVYDLRGHQLSSLPGSEGLWSSRWSPDGRYIVATTIARQDLMLFDFRSGKWRDLGVDHVSNGLTWSHHGDYIYFDVVGPAGGDEILRARAADGKIERVAALNNLARDAPWWSGLAPDDSPLVVRAIGTQEVYAMDMDWR